MKSMQIFKMMMGNFKVEPNQKPIENRVCISLRIPFGVMPKDKENLNVKFFLSLTQSFNYFGTQRKGVAIPFCLGFRPSGAFSLLQTNGNTFASIILPQDVTRSLEYQ